MSRIAAPEPYNPDPMDQRDPNEVPGDAANYLNKLEQELYLNMPPALDWAEIRRDSRAEWEARLTKFHTQKNSRMVDWLLDNPPENPVPDDLLMKTQVYTVENHPIEANNKERA